MRLDVLRKLVVLGIVLTPMAVLLPACDQNEDEAVVVPEADETVVVPEGEVIEEPAGTPGAPADDTMGGTTGGTIGGTTGTEGTGTMEPEQEY